MENFSRLFKFNPQNTLLVGVERECFLTVDDQIQPISALVLKHLGINGRFGYELSACQLEDRVGPCQLKDLKSQLLENEKIIALAEQQLKFKRSFTEVGPNSMPLDIYPDPNGRYAQLVKKMPPEVLLAACQVIGTHIHIGMPDHQTALAVYNKVIRHWPELCQMGDHSQGERLRIYKIVAPKFEPPKYQDWTEFHQQAVKNNFAHDPRSCWTLIRISVHGTIEFRMFGATTDLEKIVTWADQCHQLCFQAMTKSC